MNHAITIRDIIAILAGLVGFIASAFGALLICKGFGAQGPDDVGPTGCIITIIGAALIALSVGLLG